jgi:hypothetical protein
VRGVPARARLNKINSVREEKISWYALIQHQANAYLYNGIIHGSQEILNAYPPHQKIRKQIPVFILSALRRPGFFSVKKRCIRGGDQKIIQNMMSAALTPWYPLLN